MAEIVNLAGQPVEPPTVDDPSQLASYLKSLVANIESGTFRPQGGMVVMLTAEGVVVQRLALGVFEAVGLLDVAKRAVV